MSQATLFVSGASGHVGRQVIELLLEAGAAGRIIAGTRTPEKLADLSARGVEVRYADFHDPASLQTAFQGADRLLLISTDQLDGRTRQHVNAVEAADSVGVKHVVYTSIINATDTPVTLADSHAATEAALEASKMGWTVLRSNIYLEQAATSLQQALQFGGKLYSAAADGRQAFIAREDCARAAASALLSNFEGRRTLDITGSEALSQADLAAIATQITGTPVEYVPLPLDVHKQNLSNAGLPPFVVDLVASFDQATAEGKFENVSPDFKALTGRDPRRALDVLTEQVTA